MKKFIKEEWFKLLLIIAIFLFIALCSIPIYTSYQEFRINRYCKDYRILKSALEGNQKNSDHFIGDCILRNPELEEWYKLLVKNEAKEQTEENK